MISTNFSCVSNFTVEEDVVGSWAEFAFLLSLFFIGVIGNSLVVIVYKSVRTKSVHLYFVFMLGVIDLITSVIRKLIVVFLKK